MEIIPLVSIVVPVYNAQQFIHRCVDSILAQTYKNWELILVDDGSVDRSGEICDSYQNLDSRIHVIHQKNQGVCCARNNGLKICRGEFIGFVDADDYVVPYYAEKAIQKMVENDLDVVMFGYMIIKEHCPNRNKNFKGIRDDELKLYISYIDAWEVWNKLYRANVWKGVYFPQKITYGEDAYVMHSIMKKTKKIEVINDTLYYIERRTHGSVTEKTLSTHSYMMFNSWRYGEHYGDEEVVIQKVCYLKAVYQALNALWLNQEDHLLNSYQVDKLKDFLREKYKVNEYYSWAKIKYYDAKANLELMEMFKSRSAKRRLLEDVIKVYAANEVKPFLIPKEKALFQYYISHVTCMDVLPNQVLLYWSIRHKKHLMIKLLGKRFVFSKKYAGSRMI